MLSCHTWVWFVSLLLWLCFAVWASASAWPNFKLLCVPHCMFDSLFTEVFEFTFQTLPVLLSPCLRSPRSLVCQKSRCWEHVCGLGGLIPHECGIKTRTRLECCSQSTTAWLDVGVCLDESRSPQSQMVPFVFTILAHFCSFSLLAWISKHKKWGFHQLPVF